MLAFDRRPQFLSTWSVHGVLECPQDMAVDSHRANDSRESSEAAMVSFRSITSTIFCLLEVSCQVQLTLKTQGIRFHLWEGGLSNNWWAYFKTVAMVILEIVTGTQILLS